VKTAKPSIISLTSIRFFLIVSIVLGHFVHVAIKDPFLLKLLKQHNMLVGGFFVLSGYLLTYAYSEFNSSNTRPMPLGSFVFNRLSRVYPPYAFSLLLFIPMFIYVDLHYNYGWETLSHALCVFTLTQAWIPDWGTLWNSPTWFLSALLFCNILFPLILPKICTFSREKLFKLWIIVALTHLAINLWYSQKAGVAIMEGMERDNSWSDFFRFFPVWNFLDFFLGVITARLYMMRPNPVCDTKAKVLPLVFLALIIGFIVLRAYIPINDMLSRSAVFIPLCCAFIFYLTPDKGPLASLFKLKPLIYLGEISFAIYIIHAPIGQLFYKKVIAKQLWTTPPSFITYCLVVLAASVLLYHFVELPGQRFFKEKLKKKLFPK
jgi:peptidoglycan/LPS O-acetylase OafA/YrhL